MTKIKLKTIKILFLVNETILSISIYFDFLNIIIITGHFAEPLYLLGLYTSRCAVGETLVKPLYTSRFTS